MKEFAVKWFAIASRDRLGVEMYDQTKNPIGEEVYGPWRIIDDYIESEVEAHRMADRMRRGRRDWQVAVIRRAQ